MLRELGDRFQQTLDASTRQELLTAAVHSVGSLAPADGTRVAEIELTPTVAYRVVAQEVSGGDPSAAVRVAPLHHPLIRHYYRTRARGWVSIDDLLPGRRWLEHPLYRDVYRPAGLRSQISCALYDDVDSVVSLSLNRAGSDFTDRERTDLSRYLLLLQRLWSQIDESAKARAVVSALDRSLTDVSVLVLVLSARAEPLYVSDGLAALAARYPDLLDELRTRSETPTPWTARVTLDHTHALTVEASMSGEIVVIRARPADPLGLTVREVEVLQAVAGGDTADAIAYQLHLSVGTVHKHLEHVYVKLGVHDKVSAVAVAREHGTIR